MRTDDSQMLKSSMLCDSIVVVVVVVVVVVFTLNCSHYPTTSAVHPVALALAAKTRQKRVKTCAVQHDAGDFFSSRTRLRHLTFCVIILLEPQSRFGDKLLGNRVHLPPKRDCGSYLDRAFPLNNLLGVS